MSNPYPAATFLSNFEPQGDRPAQRLPFRSMLVQAAEGKSQKQQQADAFERGVAEGRLAALQECEALHADRMAQLSAAHAKERQSWLETEGKKLRDGLVDGLSAMEARIADLAAGVLASFAEEAVVIKAKTELVERLKAVLREGRACTISARGPKELLQYLKDALPENLEVSSEPADCELTVFVGDTVLHTTLTEWIEELRRLRNGG